MSLPRVVAVAPGSPAARAGVLPGDEIAALNGQVPRDIIEWQLLADEAHRSFRDAELTFGQQAHDRARRHRLRLAC